MENEIEKNRLTAYIGFANKKHALYVGRKLEERLNRNRIRLVLFNKSCSLKNEEKRKTHYKDNEGLLFIRYQGDLSLDLLAGYNKVKAIGISDIHLAKAIYETVERENNKEEKNVEKKQDKQEESTESR